MFVLFTNIAAIILYVIASIYCVVMLRKKTLAGSELNELKIKESSVQPFIIQSKLLKLVVSTVILHGIGVYGVIVNPEGLALGFFKVSSLITWCINLIVLISGLRKPLHNLWLFLLPMSIITIAISLLGHSPLWQDITLGIGAHILLSILAYSLFTMAVLQGILLAWQNYQLKNHRATGFIRLMPPLETMETLLFAVVWVGQILLTLGIIAGAIYIDDIFAQHLTHKTILSLLAWVIFASLLLGRHWLGWRGSTAIRWVFSGFFVLMLAFYGSKLVLEIILQR